MPTPKFKTSKSKKNTRRSHHALSMPAMSTCPNCDNMKEPHSACPSCGHYKGKQVLETKSVTEWDGEGFEAGSES